MVIIKNNQVILKNELCLKTTALLKAPCGSAHGFSRLWWWMLTALVVAAHGSVCGFLRLGLMDMPKSSMGVATMARLGRLVWWRDSALAKCRAKHAIVSILQGCNIISARLQILHDLYTATT